MKGICKLLAICILSLVMVSVFSLPARAQAPSDRRYKINMLFDMNNEKFDFDAGGELKLTGYDLLGGVGFFMSDMFEIGPEISFGESKTENGGSDELKFTHWSIGVKANAHFNPTGIVTPYIGANLAFGNREVEMGGASDDDSTFLYGGQAGFDYFIAENVSINPEIRYTMGKFTFEGVDADYTNLSFMIGIAAHL